MRHRLRLVPCAFAVAVAAITAGCGQTTVIKTVRAEPDRPKPAAKPAPGAEAPALLGDLLTLETRATTLKVRATRVIDPLPVGQYDTPDAGNRFVGVEITVKNVGDHAYTDSPSNGATVLLKGNQQADSTIVSAGPCGTGFANDVKIAAGDKRVGCIAFEVPAHKRLRALQFTPDSGFSDHTGQWRLPSVAPTATSAAPAATSAPAPAAAPAPAPVAGFNACDANISVRSASCGFAENVFYEYFVTGQSSALTAYSPAAGRSFAMLCTPGEGWIVCDGTPGGTVKFTQASIDNYSTSQAQRYAATHDV